MFDVELLGCSSFALTFGISVVTTVDESVELGGAESFGSLDTEPVATGSCTEFSPLILGTLSNGFDGTLVDSGPLSDDALDTSDGAGVFDADWLSSLS